MILIVKIFEKFNLIEFNKHFKFHLVHMVFTLDKSLILLFYPVHLYSELSIEVTIVFSFNVQILLQQLDLLMLLIKNDI